MLLIVENRNSSKQAHDVFKEEVFKSYIFNCFKQKKTLKLTKNCHYLRPKIY